MANMFGVDVGRIPAIIIMGHVIPKQDYVGFSQC